MIFGSGKIVKVGKEGLIFEDHWAVRVLSVLPVVRVPGRERRLLEIVQLAIGEFTTNSSQGLPPSPRV